MALTKRTREKKSKTQGRLGWDNQNKGTPKVHEGPRQGLTRLPRKGAEAWPARCGGDFRSPRKPAGPAFRQLRSSKESPFAAPIKTMKTTRAIPDYMFDNQSHPEQPRVQAWMFESPAECRVVQQALRVEPVVITSSTRPIRVSLLGSRLG